ncbi:MAG: hypothetical protein H7067_13835 [Burkholderiales bacterium]|nr:hypothetical protein [Opitutaceae bacterium]
MNKDADWICGGWGDHERGQLEAGAAMSFRERLLWLQDADRLAATLEKQRPWIDGDGTVHAVRAVSPTAE